MSVQPKLTETEVFGRKQRIAILGISRSANGAGVVREHYSVPRGGLGGDPGDRRHHRTHAVLPLSVIVGREPADQIGGPIQVATVSAEVATLGIAALINLAAILSISIGLINLFPIPMLDGGHLLVFRGRGDSRKTAQRKGPGDRIPRSDSRLC